MKTEGCAIFYQGVSPIPIKICNTLYDFTYLTIKGGAILSCRGSRRVQDRKWTGELIIKLKSQTKFLSYYSLLKTGVRFFNLTTKLAVLVGCREFNIYIF